MKAIIKVEGHIVPSFEIPVVQFSSSQRTKRAGKIFSILFIAGIFSILIPMLHFFLVPGLLIASVVFGVIKYREALYIDISSVKCPSCSAALNEKQIFFQAVDSSTKLFCFECRKQLEFQVISSSP